MTQAEIARRAGLSPQRVGQLIARGETAATILDGTYNRGQNDGPRCDACGKLTSEVRLSGHRRGCPRGGHRCGICRESGHNRRTCPAREEGR